MTNPKHIEQWNHWNNGGGPKYPHEKVIQFTFRNFPPDIRYRTRVLDLGCGSGVHTLFFSSEGFEVYGTDISEIGIHNTRCLLAKHGFNPELKVESVDRIGYPDGNFDFVLSIGVLDCAGFAAACSAVQEVIRVLKPGGKALLVFASDTDFRVLGANPLGLHGFSEIEVQTMIPTTGLSIRWIDRYITTYKDQKELQNDFLITLQKA